MAACGFGHLTLDERRSLFRMHEARPGIAAMVARLGRHRSTISRDLRRTRFRDPDAPWDRRHDMAGYYPMTAQDLARARRERLYNYPVVNLPIFHTVVGMTERSTASPRMGMAQRSRLKLSLAPALT